MKNDIVMTMRDAFIAEIYEKMKTDKRIFFLTADFGAPMLDKIKHDFAKRFINVGIAEQNLLNVSTGLALEGFTVYAYGIASFLSMRAYEQIRINLSMLSGLRPLNVNLISVGAGLSYDVSGPTHHCLEDLGIIRMLPNLCFFSPSDWVIVKKFIDFSIENEYPKYLRFDCEPLSQIYSVGQDIKFKDGFCELSKGKEICIVSTGYMTHRALQAKASLSSDDIHVGLIDVFLFKPLNEPSLLKILQKYKYVITIEEAFINKGGLDSLVLNILKDSKADVKFKNMGFDDAYIFEVGNRQYLHKLVHLDVRSIVKKIKDCIR